MPGPRRTPAQFFAELKRRRVIRVLIAYVVAALAVLQAASVLVPALRLPEWVTTLIALLAILGLPLALVLAWVFDVTPEGVTRTAAEGTSAESMRVRTAPLLATAVVAVTLVVGAAVWFSVGRGDAVVAVDTELFAVVPFRVGGADPSLAYLGEGMVDLLSLKITGTRRAVEPRTLLAAWHRSVGEELNPTLDQVVRLAADLTAGRVLLGSAVGSAEQLTLSAALYSVPEGDELATASVDGAVEDLPTLIDQLAAQIVSLDAGEGEERLASLTSTSQAALRAYLAGVSYYRRGLYSDAAASLAEAVSEDSTFALAALQLADVAGMLVTGAPPAAARVSAIVRANRERLGRRDYVYSLALFPDSASALSTLDRWEAAVREVPDRAEAWYHLGDNLFHNGALREVDGFLGRAKDAFSRALALDPSYFNALHHLVWIAMIEGDTAFAAPVMDEYLAKEQSGGVAAEFKLRLATMRKDTAAIRRAEAAMDSLESDFLLPLAWAPLGVNVFDFTVRRADRAASILLARATTPAARTSALEARYHLALNTGRPELAESTLRELAASTSQQAALAERRRINSAVYWGGDVRVAQEAGHRLQSRADLDLPDTYALATWQLWNGETGLALPAITRLRASRDATDRLRADVLELWRASEENDPRTLALAQQLAATVRQSGLGYEVIVHANLTLARVFESLGDVQKARAATRRIIWNVGGDRYVSTLIRERARLSAALGEREEAIEAYNLYLLMMAEAEPAAMARVEEVRSALAALQGR